MQHEENLLHRAPNKLRRTPRPDPAHLQRGILLLPTEADPVTVTLFLAETAATVLQAWSAAHGVESTAPMAAVSREDPELAAMFASTLLGATPEERMQGAKALVSQVHARPDQFLWDEPSTPESGPLPRSLPVGGIITPV